MSKHIIDQPRGRDEGKRLREFSKIQRLMGDESASVKVRALQRATRAATGTRRVAEFLEIERGKTV